MPPHHFPKCVSWEQRFFPWLAANVRIFTFVPGRSTHALLICQAFGISQPTFALMAQTPAHVLPSYQSARNQHGHGHMALWRNGVTRVCELVFVYGVACDRMKSPCEGARARGLRSVGQVLFGIDKSLKGHWVVVINTNSACDRSWDFPPKVYLSGFSKCQILFGLCRENVKDNTVLCAAISMTAFCALNCAGGGELTASLAAARQTTSHTKAALCRSNQSFQCRSTCILASIWPFPAPSIVRRLDLP